MSKSVHIQPADDVIAASVQVPGSKSYANRALVLACLAQNPVALHNVPVNDDVTVMRDALALLGIILKSENNAVIVENSIFDLSTTDVTIDLKQSGTCLRFLASLCCLIPGKQVLTGHQTLMSRPIDPLLQSLKKLGADIERSAENDIIISSSVLSSGEVGLDASVSSQLLTSLLMIAPVIGLDIRVTQLATKSYIEITKDIMQDFGVTIIATNEQFSVQKKAYEATEYTIEPDISSAGYFWALGALSGGSVTVEQVDRDTKQGDIQILQILEKMGAQISYSHASVSITGGVLKPVEVDMSRCPDQIQTIAVIAAFAGGISKIHGAYTLRLKETDRLSAVINELKKMDIDAETDGQTLVIHGGDPKAAEIETYLDHRMAMSFAIAGSRLNSMSIQNSEVVNKTFPEFWNVLQSTGVKVL